MSETIDSVLEFWFGRGQSAIQIAEEKSELWWSKDDRIDAEIADRFTATIEAATDGRLSRWLESPRGLLAQIICLDQFSRNIYRDTPDAFINDIPARVFAEMCVNNGAAQQLAPIERVFAYLPFEHSEELIYQQRSVELYEALAASVAPDETELFNNYLDFARKHFEIIERFGRFPHRNQILGRASTEEEETFLTQPGSSF